MLLNIININLFLLLTYLQFTFQFLNNRTQPDWNAANNTLNT